MSASILETAVRVAPPRKRTANKTLWTGRIITGIAVLLMGMDLTMKLTQAPEAVTGTVQLGFAADQLIQIGLAQLFCFVLYVIPRTAPLGAVLLTGYLGGAVATHLRLGNPVFTHLLSPIYMAAIIWTGLFLSDARVRAVLGRKR